VLPYGIVVPFAGVTPPTGWLICDGSSLLRSSYPGLFTAIGTAFGAVDGAHFNIPDLRGRVIAGMDPTGTRLTGATISPDGNTLGGAGGAQTEAAGVSVNVSGGVSVSVSVSGSLGGQITSGSASAGGSAGGPNYAYINDTVAVSGTLSGGGSGSFSGSGTGGTNAITNVQPTLLMNWIIKT
jgi:microcystin-dependent protein